MGSVSRSVKLAGTFHAQSHGQLALEMLAPTLRIPLHFTLSYAKGFSSKAQARKTTVMAPLEQCSGSAVPSSKIVVRPRPTKGPLELARLQAIGHLHPLPVPPMEHPWIAVVYALLIKRKKMLKTIKGSQHERGQIRLFDTYQGKDPDLARKRTTKLTSSECIYSIHHLAAKIKA